MGTACARGVNQCGQQQLLEFGVVTPAVAAAPDLWTQQSISSMTNSPLELVLFLTGWVLDIQE